MYDSKYVLKYVCMYVYIHNTSMIQGRLWTLCQLIAMRHQGHVASSKCKENKGGEKITTSQ